MRALKFAWLTLLNAIFVNAKCGIEILSLLIHNSCNNTISAFLTTYFSIVCITFVDRLQFCSFEIWRIWSTRHVVYYYFLRSILMRDILRMKYLLHDAFCHNLHILNQYTDILDLIYTCHTCDYVYYAHLHKINTLQTRCTYLLYVQIFDIYCIAFQTSCW